MTGWHQRYLGLVTTQLIAPLLLRASQHDPTLMGLQPSRCASCADLASLKERGSWNYSGFYLFICLSSPLFHTVALFPKLTNVLELIECDPLTAAWNNEASFPHIFSPQDGLSLLHFGPHQSALSVWNLGLKELLIMLRAQGSIFTASAPRERWYYWDKSHAFRVRRQQSYTVLLFFSLVCSLLS